MIRLACLDMAGTTVADGGLVEEAFAAAMAATARETGIAAGSARYERAQAYVRDTMGQSKIEVFRALLGDEGVAQRATAAFERAYDGIVGRGDVAAIPGAREAFARLRAGGVQVALTTGFGPSTRDALLDALGWRDAVDLALCPADAGRGRPWPDMILTALLRLGVDAVQEVAVAGDTSSDVVAGLRAGAPVVAGVLTGAHDETTLRAAGATHVLPSVVDVADLLLTTPTS